ncbi:hypothetical protein HII16_07320 [Thalassotalea sp. Y01]|nr:hypothetical protein [Thalassotalea sp. Y01]
MFVCICHQITEADLANAVEQGANTMKEIRDQLSVASQCGKCVQFAKQVLAEHNCNYDLAVKVA